MLMNQVGFKPVSIGAIDRCLGIHRSTRIRCLAELRELGFIAGTDSHFVLNDPLPILKDLRSKKDKALKEADELLDAFSTDTQQELTSEGESSEKKLRDYMQEATDAWNRYRPKDYHKIRRISAPLVKALDIHMRELGIKAHHYEEFFSILKTGIERSEFWSKNNSNKTLQSITGIGSPTDKKKLNVYSLFNDGVDAPAASVEEVERNDTITFPAEYRPLIDEYEAAQTAYSNAYFSRSLDEGFCDYIRRTEAALKQAGLDPAMFRYKYGIKNWPTDTPEPDKARVVNWKFDDEYCYGR